MARLRLPFESCVFPIDGKKILLLRLVLIEGSMPICSCCHHEAPLIEYVTRRISDRTILYHFGPAEVRLQSGMLALQGLLSEYVDRASSLYQRYGTPA